MQPDRRERPTRGLARGRRIVRAAARALEPLESRLLMALVSGSVYEDSNVNNQSDTGEAGIAAVSFSLYTDDGDGVAEPGADDPLEGSAASLADGSFSFNSLPPGTYWLQIDTSSPSLSGFKPSGSVQPVLVNLSGAPSVTGLEYGFYHPITVTRSTDRDSASPSPGDLTMREALTIARSQPGPDVIDFFSGGSFSIALDSAYGQLAFDTDVLLLGSAPASCTIIAGATSRIGVVSAAASVEIRNVSLQAGHATDGASLKVDGGSLLLRNSEVAGAVSTTGGGSILVASGAALTLRDSVVRDGISDGSGAAIRSSGTLTILNSALYSNESSLGGGAIQLDAGNATLVNATLMNNTADRDGNGSGVGGAIRVAPSATLTLHNTLIADNYRGTDTTLRDDLSGQVSIASSCNLLTTREGASGLDLSGSGNQTGTLGAPLDAKLIYPKSVTSTSSKTAELSYGSPAIDAGSNARAAEFGLAVDQRGAPRATDFDHDGVAQADIGAYESNPVTVVTTLVDRRDDSLSSPDLSFREAVEVLANNSPGLDVVTFAPSLSGGTINFALADQIDLMGDVCVVGPGSGLLTIDAQRLSRVLYIWPNIDVMMQGIELTRGESGRQGDISDDGPGIYVNAGATVSLRDLIISDSHDNLDTGFGYDFGDGGGIYNAGTVFIEDSTLTANFAASNKEAGFHGGGGIYNALGASLTVTRTNFIGNQARTAGGAILNDFGATATITDSIISGNGTHNAEGTRWGAGILNAGKMILDRVLISANDGHWEYGTGDGHGGGIHNHSDAELWISNSTIVNNNSGGLAAGAGGIENWGKLTAVHITVTGNNREQLVNRGLFSMRIYNSVFSGNNVFNDVGGSATTGMVSPDSAGNFIGTTDMTDLNPALGNIWGVPGTHLDPLLGPLASNGGFSQTRAPLVNSPLIDAGSSVVSLDINLLPIVTDQRGQGYPREVGADVDIGAFELGGDAAIGDLVWNDANANGQRDAGEIGIDAVAVRLYASDGDNVFEPGGDDTLVASRTTQAGGLYSFTSLSPGQYWVYVDPAGSGPLAQYADTTANNPLQVDLSLNQQFSTADFGFRPQYVVSTTADENDGNYTSGDLSLREALLLARNNPGADLIEFAPSLAGATIVLAPALGSLLLDSDVTIVGNASRTQISAGGSFRVLSVGAGVSATLSDLILADGQSSEGGNLYVAAGADVHLNRVALLNGVATLRGGAAYLAAGASMQMTDSEIAGSRADVAGGGIYSEGALDLGSSSIHDNQSTSLVVGRGRGGGIYVAGSLNASNTTIANNTATLRGGGLYAEQGAQTLLNLTIAGNVAATGGGAYVDVADLTLHNTVIGDNFRAAGAVRDDLFGSIDPASSYSFLASGAGSSGIDDGVNGNRVGSAAAPIDPRFLPLGFYGGFTPTVALRADSPLLDAGSAAASPGLIQDQRGQPRVMDFDEDGTASIDIGAYEANPRILVDALNDESTDTDGKTSLREALAQADAQPGLDIIQLASSLLTGGSAQVALGLGELVIGSDVRIEGPADGKVSIHAAAASRVVTISAGASVTMTNLTLTDGVGIDGGAIDNHGNLTVDGVLFVGNTATGDGGAIINNSGATLTLLNTTISGNSANGRGGAIFQAGGTMTLVNATIYNNVADADDSGDPAAAGGIHVAAGTATLSNTVAAGNHRGSASPAAADVAGAFAASSSFNFIGAIDGSTGLLGAGTQSGTSASPIDPRMNPLADNGGPTMTHSVLAGSPLTDSGNDSLASAAGLTADQRGLPRFKDGNDDHIDRVDIGAFEQQFSLNQAPILTSISTILGAAEARTFTIRYDLLLQSSDAVDPDAMAQPISFRIMSVLQGTLAYNGAPVVPGITLLGAGGSLVWTPPALNFGDNSSLTIPAFTVAAFDGALNSASPVQVKIEVTSAAEPVNYAVLFSGGDSPDFNFPYYYSNLKSLYQTITTRYGVKPQNIYVVYADGRDPASDMKGGVNGDMTFAQNVLSATSDNLRTTLLSLSQLADANDHFLFWCYDHGFGATDQPSIHDEELVKGWGGDEVISNDQLRVWLQGLSGSDSEATYDVPAGYQGIRAGYNTYVFSQCFAGGPLDSLSLDSTHFGMAASNHYEASYADNFAAAFNAALGAGYATTDATFSYAFAHDGRAADGGRNGGAWQFNVEHPWSDGGNFPIFAGISGQNSTPVFNSIAPLRCNSAATSLTITYDMLKAAADASDPSGQSLRFRITSVNVGTILRNGVPINLSDPAQTTIGFGDSVVWQRPGGSTGLLSGVFGIVAVASDGTISATRQASIRIGSPAGGPTAADDARTLQYNSVAALLDPLANDGGVGKRVLRVGVASHGIVTLDSVTGQVRYTPAIDYVGGDVFTYLITDGIVTDIASFSLNVVPFDPSVLNSSNYRWTITELDPAPRWAGLPQSWDWTYRSSLTDWASSSAVDISNDGAVLVRITRPDQPNGLLDYVGSTNAAYRWYAGSGDPFWNYVLTGSGASQTAQTSTNTLVLLRGTASTQNGRQVFDGVDASHVGGGNVMPGIAYDPGNGMDGLTNIAGFAGGGGFWYDVGSGAEFWQDLPADIIPVDISSGATNDATYWGAMTNTGQFSGAVQHAELWHFSRNTVSSMISLPGWAGSHASQAYAINGAGMAVGWAEYQSGDYRAFLHNGSGMIHLAVLGSYTESAAYSINDAGVAVGFSGSSVQSDQSGIATLWQSGAATSLGSIGGGGWSVARDINNSNMVVGASNGHAFVWISGTMYDLNSMLQGALPGVVLTSANAINDAGQIAATGTVAGQTRGFFLDLRSLLQASADTVPASTQGTAQFNVLANDTGSNLSIVSVNTTGMLGTLVWSADGSMTYDPAGAFANLAPGQSASTSFSYLATDSWGATATVTVTINLTAAAVSRPSAPQLMTAWDSGISSSDGLTRYNNSAPSQVMHFNIGNTVAGATVQLFADGILIGQATAASSSTEITTNGTLLLSDGPHLITSVQILPSNAASAASDPFVIVVDAHAPAVTGTFEYLSQQRLVLHLDDNPSGTLSADDLQLVNLSTSQTVPGSTLIMSFDPGTNTAKFRVNGYGGMLPDGNYRLTLPAGSIADAAGNALSVAWSMDFFVLGGDADHNRMVDLNDLYILASNWRGSGKVFNQGDFNYDGKVDAKDLGILSINWQRSLPVPAPAPPLTALRRAPTRSPVRVISLVDPQSAT